MSRLYITGSQLQDFERCPEYHRALWLLNRERIGPENENLLMGTWAHEALAILMRWPGTSPVSLPWFGTNAKWQALHLAIQAWADRYSMDVYRPWTKLIETENPLETPLVIDEQVILVSPKPTVLNGGKTVSILGQEVWLLGTPDAWVIRHGKLWHVQHKTLDQSQSIANFAFKVAQSLHESIYAILGMAHWPELEYGGTMLNIIRKISLKRAKESPHEALHLEFIPITPEQIERAKLDLLYCVRHFHDGWRRRSACSGPPYGKCPYYEACWQGASLDDDILYQTRKSRYPQVHQVEE